MTAIARCRIPLTPSPSPARGEGGRASAWAASVQPASRANLLPSPLAGEGLGVRGPSGGADNLTRSFDAPPRIRTSSGSFEGCHAFQHTRRAIRKNSKRKNRSTRRLTPSARWVSSRSHVSTWIRTRTRTFGGSECVPLHHRDHQSARARGVEPRKAVLEAAGSPGSTLV
jgi:hypothetical protein